MRKLFHILAVVMINRVKVYKAYMLYGVSYYITEILIVCVVV